MRWLLLTASCIALAVLTACGGSSSTTESARPTKHVQHVHSFEAYPQGSVIHISMGTRPCRAPSIDRIEVLRRHPRIVLRAFMAHSWVPEPVPPDVERSCPDEEISVSGKVDLGEPVGDRAIYDAFRQPPVKRWPD